MFSVMTKRSVLLALGVMAIALLLPVAGEACAVCWGSDDILEQGLSWSIVFLMAMPFTISGSIGGWLFYSYRRAQNLRLKKALM